jgi:hypothetical protein
MGETIKYRKIFTSRTDGRNHLPLIVRLKIETNL